MMIIRVHPSTSARRATTVGGLRGNADSSTVKNAGCGRPPLPIRSGSRRQPRRQPSEDPEHRRPAQSSVPGRRTLIYHGAWLPANLSMCFVPSPSTRHSSFPCGSGRQVVRFWAESRVNGRALNAARRAGGPQSRRFTWSAPSRAVQGPGQGDDRHGERPVGKTCVSGCCWCIQAAGFREHGMALSLSYNPTPSPPLGFYGPGGPVVGRPRLPAVPRRCGAARPWGEWPTGVAQGNRLDGEVGYGLPVGSRFVGTPRVGFSTSEYGRDLRLRLRPRRADPGEPDVRAGGRRAAAQQSDVGPPEHRGARAGHRGLVEQSTAVRLSAACRELIPYAARSRRSSSFAISSAWLPVP